MTVELLPVLAFCIKLNAFVQHAESKITSGAPTEECHYAGSQKDILYLCYECAVGIEKSLHGSVYFDHSFSSKEQVSLDFMVVVTSAVILEPPEK